MYNNNEILDQEPLPLETLASLLGQVLNEYDMIKGKVQEHGISWRTFKTAVMQKKGLDIDAMQE